MVISFLQIIIIEQSEILEGHYEIHTSVGIYYL